MVSDRDVDRIPVGHWDTGQSLDQHMKLISRQVERSMRDPETRQLAVKIVSGAFDYVSDPRTGERVPIITAWGKRFRAPESGLDIRARDDEAEIIAMWDFVVLNVRYVYDPVDVDTFATAKHTLDAGGGDCDDGVILFAALLKSIGFRVIARVIATKQDPQSWVHTYALVGVPKDNPDSWITLDWTVARATPGWEYPGVAAHEDFEM